MTLSSSHSACTRGTGTAVPASARNTRNSRSTACALASKAPIGFRRNTYFPEAASRRKVGLDWPPSNCTKCDGPR